MKKVVNSVLASALALSVAPMAFAAEDATTTAPKMDAAMEKTVKRLEALGLVAGYGNNDFGVDRTITRAEFATLIVRARGLEQGAKLAQFNKTYTDVNSTDWFAGFVNVASGEEIVKGFPDKSFKPQNQVTYAEAVTMIVRALGYEPSVNTSAWPNNMISKASELNIAKGISNPNNAAVRGDVFKMLDNALRVDLMEQKEFGTDIRFEITNKTLLTKYLKVTVRDMDWAHEAGNDSDDLPLVTNVPAIGLGKVKANEVTLNGKDAGLGNTTYKVADGINPNEYDGQKVQVWIKDDKENVIVWMEGSEDEEVVMDRVKDFFLKGKAYTDASSLSKSDLEDMKLELDASGKSYRLTKDTKVTYNFTRYNDPVDGLKKIIKDRGSDTYGVKVVLNDANEIAYIHVIDDQTIDKSVKGVKYGSKVISKIDADKKKITNLDSSKFNELEDQDEGKDFLVFLDGKPAKFSDLKELDVYSIYYADGDEDKYLIFATRKVEAGKVEKVVSRNSKDIRVTVNGKTLKVYTNASYSENANKDVKKIDSSNLDLISNLDGEEVKLYLDASGRVRHIETKDAIDDRKPKAIVTRQATENTSKDTFDFVVMTQKGKKENISLDKKNIYDAKGVNFDKNGKAKDLINILKPRKDGDTVLLELNYDSKGNVDKVRILDAKLKAASGSTWNNLADEDDNVVGDYEVTDKTAIFKMTGELTDDNRVELKSPGTAKFKAIADKDSVSVYYSVNEDKGEVEAIFVIQGNGLGSDVRFGMVKDYGTVNKQDSVKLVTKDGDSVVEKEFKLDGDKEDLQNYKDIKRGDFISFTVNADNEVEVDDVMEVVNGSAIDEDSWPLILDQDEWSKAGIDNMVVAHVDKVDGNTITYKKKPLYTKAGTAFIDVYDDLEGEDGVEEGDYIVLIDASDVNGTRFDYVVIVSSDDEVKKYNVPESSVEAFLKQTKDKPDPVKIPELSGIKGEAVESELLPGVFNYTVTGKIKNDESVKSFTLKVGTKTTKVTIKDGTFSASQIGKADQDGELTIVYTDKDGKEQTITEDVTF
ncbi:S-layer homology domain-containing protein [uncultured Brevibacillus sp.]|uniref:S-layer homology domain-containing protein n=1 Tax=uncultured Brevibacillus sp. TaxID=169970 RepID=UPI00259520E8|nr:S-layer homology domain-containing protein [uncultured Brevibacillus sp.]